MSQTPGPRMGLFLGASALLIVFAVLLGGAGHSGSAPTPPPPRPSVVASASAIDLLDAARREEARIRAAAARFLSAFLRYEVGDLTPSVAASLRALATPAFARQLVRRPPRQTGRPRGRARIERLDVSFVSARRALLSGVARRAEGPEEFSFLFTLHRGRWLAAGVAE